MNRIRFTPFLLLSAGMSFSQADWKFDGKSLDEGYEGRVFEIRSINQ